MERSAFEVVDAEVSKLEESGAFSPSRRRQVLNVLKHHGWSEEEFIDEHERRMFETYGPGPLAERYTQKI